MSECVSKVPGEPVQDTWRKCTEGDVLDIDPRLKYTTAAHARVSSK